MGRSVDRFHPRSLTVVYAVELRFAIPDPARAPSIEVISESVRRNRPSAADRLEHVRVSRRPREFRAVLFVTSSSLLGAELAGARIGVAAAAEITAVGFAGVWPWPNADDDTAHESTADQ
jgi:hypothetical protein